MILRTKVIPLSLSISNAYLVLGDQPILVDAGAPGEEERLFEALGVHGITPSDIALVALTHGHTDHTGSVNAVASAGAPIAVGAADAQLLINGENVTLPATGPAGKLLRNYIFRMRFSGATPQILVTEPLRLEPYGVRGTIVPVAGHTPGSCVVLLDGGDAVIGDLARGGYAYGRIRRHRPLRHFFAEDVEGVRRALQMVLDTNPSRLFVGHGGPVLSTAETRRRFDSIAPHERKPANL